MRLADSLKVFGAVRFGTHHAMQVALAVCSVASLRAKLLDFLGQVAEHGLTGEIVCKLPE